MPATKTHPINIIYSGVAGTGKTYQLLQIAKRYTDPLPSIDSAVLVSQLIADVSWRDTVCLILLDLQSKQQELARVPEIMAHEFFVAKAAQNERDKNLSNTLWAVLGTHSPADSATVTHKNRAAQAYFDKDDSGAWYLLPEAKPLLSALMSQLDEFYQAQREAASIAHQATGYERFSMVSFHQAYGYEEFVEGIRPVTNTPHNHSPQNHLSHNQSSQNVPSQISYSVQDGAFLSLCKRAAQDPHRRYAMLIDEINRANVARVFGELLSLIEPDKRAGMPNAMSVTLAYSGRAFSVPSNVDIYATMNTQDHSLAPLDMALRRRFRFIDCPPQPELLPVIEVSDNDKTTIDLPKVLIGLNTRIAQMLGSSAQLGHAFLWHVRNLADLQLALTQQIIPQLAQAAGGQVAVLQFIFADTHQALDEQFIQDPEAIRASQSPQMRSQPPASLFNDAGFMNHAHISHLGASEYQINPDLLDGVGAFADPAVYQRLYEEAF